MEKDLIIVQDKKPYVGTWELSRLFQMEHRRFTILLKKYASDFGDVKFIWINPREYIAQKGNVSENEYIAQKGKVLNSGAVKSYLLDEKQAAYITSLLRNAPRVRKFKEFLASEFIRQRELLAKAEELLKKKYANHDDIWIKIREEGKKDRRRQTDEIKRFIERCQARGERGSYDKYYMLVTLEQNKALFYEDFIENNRKNGVKNHRDVMDANGLAGMKVSDRVVEKALADAALAGLSKDDTWRLVRGRIEALQNMMGKIPQPKIVGMDGNPLAL